MKQGKIEDPIDHERYDEKSGLNIPVRRSHTYYFQDESWDNPKPYKWESTMGKFFKGHEIEEWIDIPE